jgi:pyruvate-formate lyase-activating enzyme
VGNLPVDNAYDVVKNLPGIVNMNNSLMLGGQEVTVVINGKVTTLSAEQLDALLKSIPVSRIEKAEVMYSAPARYQVRGPMINLILAPGTGQASSLQGELYTAFNQHHYESLAERGSLLYSGRKFSADLLYSYSYDRDRKITEKEALHTLADGSVHQMDMDEIMEKILADRELYGNGGVILSGGDPLMQPEAATAVLKKCKEHGIRTAIETTAFAKPLAFSRFIANADMIIIDLKHYSEKKYVQFTGVSNHSILENLDFAISIGKKVAVRITITPGINDTLIDARRYAHLLSEHHIRHVILLSYSNLGIIKYEKYMQSPTLAREQTFSGQDMENYANMLRGLGFDVQIEQ